MIDCILPDANQKAFVRSVVLNLGGPKQPRGVFRSHEEGSSFRKIDILYTPFRLTFCLHNLISIIKVVKGYTWGDRCVVLAADRMAASRESFSLSGIAVYS